MADKTLNATLYKLQCQINSLKQSVNSHIGESIWERDSADDKVYLINSNEYVGVGNIVNPHLYSSGGNELVIGGTGNHGMTIRTGSGQGVIYFADTESNGLDGRMGQIRYQHSSDAMYFATSGTNAVVINSSGEVGIGQLVVPTVPLQIYDANPVIKLTNPTTGGLLGDGTNFYLSGLDAYLVNKETGSLFFGTDDAVRVTVDSTGNVGIGTTLPSSILHVHSSSSGASPFAAYDEIVLERAANAGINILTPDANLGGLFFTSPNTTGDYGAGLFYGNDYGVLEINTKNAGAEIAFSSGDNVEAIRIDENQNVGIGNNNPSVLLHVGGGTDLTQSVRLETDAAEWDVFVNAAENFQIKDQTTVTAPFTIEQAAPTDSLYVDSAGNVGIGTPSPGDKLHVLGDIRAESNTGAVDLVLDGFTGNDANIYFRENNINKYNIFYDQSINEGLRIYDYINGYNALFYDPTLKSWGVGTVTPTTKLSVYEDTSDEALISFKNVTTGAVAGNGLDVGINDSEQALIWQYENESMLFATNNTEAMRIDASQNVGIGTDSPNSILHLDAGASQTILTLQSDTGVNGYIKYADGANLTAWNVMKDTNRDFKIARYNDAGAFVDNPFLITNDDGYVGIGIAAPDGKLHVQEGSAGTFTPPANADSFIVESSGNSGMTIVSPDANSSAIVFSSPGSTGTYDTQIDWSGTTELLTAGTNSTNGQIVFKTGLVAEAMRIDENQNIGIGTTSPTELLDIDGDAIRLRQSQTPASAGATGTTGMIAWDANYIYVCTATDTWVRAALATW